MTVLTICLAWEGLSLDFAAIAANSTSFFNASIFELNDFIVCNFNGKKFVIWDLGLQLNLGHNNVKRKCNNEKKQWAMSCTFTINSFSAGPKFFFSSLEIKS